jgi:GT2 family glycosyltransferase
MSSEIVADHAALPLVAVLVCCLNQRRFLPDCFQSLRRQDYGRFRTYLLDNASSDGSAEYVEVEYPECTVMRTGGNLGFATANNLGLRRAFADGAEFCVLLNTDTAAEPSMISELVTSYLTRLSTDASVGLVQATVLLFEQRDRVNTTGNALHYLGYGFCRDYFKLHVPLAEDRRILSASGAAMLISKRYYEAVGGFDDEFFVYNEDQNLSWRGLLQGFTHVVSARAIVYHKYAFREHSFKMYHSEKNRLMMLLENYTGRTLALLAPMLLLNEAMIVLHAAGNGWLWAKLRSYGYLLSAGRLILKRRQAVARTRTVKDGEIFREMDAALDFHGYQGWLIRRVVSPLMAGYHRAIARCV